MSDDIVTRLRDVATLRGNLGGSVIPVACIDAANWIELYRDIIWHLWAHRQGCGSQTCALCTEAYRVYTEEYERMIDDE